MQGQSHKTPFISIITVNYNQADVTNCLLNSLKDISYKNMEVWVVDNGSVLGNAKIIRAAHPWVSVLETSINLGFAGGNNYAFPYTKGEYILYLNNDIEVAPNFLEPLITALQNKEVGMVSPKILFFYKPNTIQYAGSTKLNYLLMRNRHIGFSEIDTGQFNRPSFTHFAHGAAMMVSRELIQKIGLMFDGYFLYYEELDWCQRAKKAGYKILYEPASVVYHKESVSTGKESVLKTYYQNRNRLLFLRRNAKGLEYAAGLTYFLLIAFPKRLLLLILKRKNNHTGALIRSLLWHINPKKYEYFT